MFVPQQPMTLRRFVRVTIDNFRQLIQSYAPVATLPMAASHVPTPTASADDGEGTQDIVSSPAAAARALAADAPPPEPVASLNGDAADAEEALIAPPAGTASPVRDETVDELVILEETIGAPLPADAFVVAEEAAAAPAAGIEMPAVVETATSPEAASESQDAPAGDAPAPDPAPSTPETSGLVLGAALESLLFVAEEPLEPAYVARVFGLDGAAIEAALQTLEAEYRAQRRGLRIQMRNGRYQMVTAPEAAGLIETFLNLDTSSKLSGPALETLAVVAYRQPVTRAQIEAVRGVDCSGVLRSLLQRGLVEEVGRMDSPGRPVLYGVSDLFMRHFGLTGLHELPPLANEENSRIDEIISVEENPPSV
jgi:segregation and condensation protein B